MAKPVSLPRWNSSSQSSSLYLDIVPDPLQLIVSSGARKENLRGFKKKIFYHQQQFGVIFTVPIMKINETSPWNWFLCLKYIDWWSGYYCQSGKGVERNTGTSKERKGHRIFCLLFRDGNKPSPVMISLLLIFLLE